MVTWIRKEFRIRKKYDKLKSDWAQNAQINFLRIKYNENPKPKISKKLKSLSATQWDWGENLTKKEFFSIKNIKEKINNQKDLFNRKHKYEKVKINNSFPEYILKNQDKLKDWIIK